MSFGLELAIIVLWTRVSHCSVGDRVSHERLLWDKVSLCCLYNRVLVKNAYNRVIVSVRD